MKKQFLALIGGVMVAGLAMAAEVVGNNEAVVIQKAKVESATGFQFLCVPVAPLDITGGTAGTLTLAGVFPPELYKPIETETTISITQIMRTVEGNSITYTVIGTSDENTTTYNWCLENGTVDNDAELDPGEILWLRTVTADNSTSTALLSGTEDSETEDASIVFCGQSIDADPVTGTAGQMLPRANVTSEAKTLGTLVTDPTKNSVVYAIAADSTDYKTYTYTGSKWITPNPKGGKPLDANDVEIAAGEAFYYYKK